MTSAAGGDVAAITISIAAVVVSAVLTLITVHATRTAAKVANYQRIHEMLVDPLAARGRKKLFLAATAGTFPEPTDPAWDEINYALALYDTLGTYVHLNQVPREIVLQTWNHPIAAIDAPAQEFFAYRRSIGIEQPWTYFIDLLELVRAYTCMCTSCQARRASQVRVP